MSDVVESPPKKSARPVEGFVLLLALIALVPVGKAVMYDTLDPDMFIHLQAANQMARDGIGPIVDQQSYMSVREPWTPYSWLGEFVMKALWDLGGYRAALATHALLAATLICLYARASVSRTTPSRLLASILATAFAAFLTIPYLSFRPVTMALVVMAIIVWLLVRDRAAGERTKFVWLVVPLTALLINLHLYAIIVPAWLVALWTGSLWEWSRGDERAERARRLRRCTLLALGTLLACLATPMLPGAIRSIVYYQFGDAMVAGPTVKEYQPFYTGTMGQVAAALVAIMLLTIAVRFRGLRAGEILWLLGSIVLLFRMGRFSPVFAMVAAPIFAASLPALSDRVLGTTLVRLAAMAAIGCGLFYIIPALPSRETTLEAWLNRNGPTMPGYPVGAAAWVERNVTPRTGRLVNDYNWGGYLSWRLGPKYKVFLDGRTNLFTPDFWRATYLGSEEQRREILRRADAEVAIVPTSDWRFEPLLRAMGWSEQYTDGRATVLTAPGVRVAPASTRPVED